MTTDEIIDDIIYNKIKNSGSEGCTLESIVEEVKKLSRAKKIDIPVRKCKQRTKMRLRKMKRIKTIELKGKFVIKNPSHTWAEIDAYFRR